MNRRCNRDAVRVGPYRAHSCCPARRHFPTLLAAQHAAAEIGGSRPGTRCQRCGGFHLELNPTNTKGGAR